jgi:hypothetical protein
MISLNTCFVTFNFHCNKLSLGAVRVDLSYADKTIRRPGSAPELADKRPGSPVRSALRRQQTDQQRLNFTILLRIKIDTIGDSV